MLAIISTQRKTLFIGRERTMGPFGKEDSVRILKFNGSVVAILDSCSRGGYFLTSKSFLVSTSPEGKTR